MRRVLLPAVLSVVTMLSACGTGGTTTPTVATLDLTGASTAVVGTTPKLTAVAKDASGNTISSTVSYTSDQPNVIAVDSSGNLTVKRLTATSKPVTITATAGSVSDTLQITTYGLEIALGTSNFGDGNPGLVLIGRFRPVSGKTQYQGLNITSPLGQTEMRCYFIAEQVEDYCRTYLEDTSKYPNGEYTASITHGGTTYTTKASISSRSNLLPVPQNVSAISSGRTVIWNANSVAGAALYLVNLVDPDGLNTYWAVNNLPATRTPGSDVAAGTYNTYIDAVSFDFSDFSNILPTNINISYAYGGDVTLPAP